LLCSLASKHVKVALSGDAGDEIFCGYNRYRIGQSVWPKIRRLPHSIRKQFGQILINTKPSIWDKFSSISNQSRLGEKMHKLGSVIGSKDIHELYENICTEWSSTESIVLNSNDLGRSEQGLKVKSELIGAEYMMFSDLFSYLPGDILTKVDRASMAHSLETRAPFLDHRLVEEAWKLPLEHKIRNGQSKSILRDILVQYVPKHLTDRPKMGFAIPIGAWLRTELREWAEDLLSVHRLSTDGFLDVKMVRKIWDEHLSKRFNHEKKLWSILMFQSWLAQQDL
jgi:asparagine synthase (glutamine-hydrolysing)